MERDISDTLAALASTDHHERYAAVAALLDLRDRAVVPQLIAALESPHAFVCTWVAAALGQLGDERAVPPLIDTLLRRRRGDVDVLANVGEAAARALAALRDPRAVDALAQALDDPFVEYAAVGALNRIGDPRAVGPLIAAVVATHNPSMATALGNLGNKEAVEPLIALLSGIQSPELTPPEQKKREDIFYYYVIRALGKLGDARAGPLLAWIRDHETTPVHKGRSLGLMAERALQRIREHQEQPPTASDTTSSSSR